MQDMYRTERFFRLHIVLAVFAAAVLMISAGDLLAQEDPEPLEQRIDRLIEQLGDADYSVRERAQDELAQLGFDAYDALIAATNHEDLEIATRARYLLLLIPAQWNAENEPEQVRRYLEHYQSQPREVRLALLQRLARLSGGVGVAALCRLVRFEKATLWSKHAAVEILNGEPPDQAGRARWTKTLREHLRRSGRPGTSWLLTYLQLSEDPKATLAAWTKLVQTEQAVLKRSPDRSSPRIVAALLYYLAMAQAEQGNRELAERTAAEARQLGPGKAASLLDAHLDTAAPLLRRGMFQWAQLEYRHVIDAEVPAFVAKAQVGLAEMWHDQGENLSAAEALGDVVRLIDEKKLDSIASVRRSDGELRGRMNYFYACHWRDKGDLAKHRKYLDEAIKADTGEIDALIARRRLPNPAPEYHQKTLQLIEKAASALRKEIGDSPRHRQPVYYNQFAWLVGNTEGDLDEALECAKKAVELRPDSGAFLDTLAHVYFHRGDLENAVKHQTKAAEFEPHSGLISKQLDVFRKALEEKQKRDEAE